jgi:putative flippase GtrA
MNRLIRLLPEPLQPLVRNEAFGQLVRFVVAGLGVTLFASLVYLAFAYPFHLKPLAANTVSYAAGFTVGYLVHSRWSFRAGTGDDRAMLVRFLIASGFAFGLNSLWVWLATALLRLPPWSPVPAMIFATPLASFLLNRYWVFRTQPA